MKKINKMLVLLLTAVLFAGCADEFLNRAPEGATLTAEQKRIAIEKDPSLLSADVAGLSANMTEFAGILGNRFHNDFGFAAACLYMDSNGADMVSANLGYNWFSPNADYTDRLYSSARTLFMWNLFYKHIASANLIIGSIEPDTDNKTLKAYLGQALAVRAFDYLNLAQLHQFTYLGNESKPCVPIVTEKTTMEQAGNNPRATVEQVYALILDDLNKAVGLLEGYRRPDKGYVNQSVAMGLRARTHLLMGKYAEAAADAAKALELSGATPYTMADVSKPAFWNANDKTVMWANIITAENDIVKSSIVNMPSHLCSFFTDGYVGVGVWKKINRPLWEQIPVSDVRKGWWLDDSKESPLTQGAKYEKWFETASGDAEFGPMTNVKFGADGDNLVTLTPAQDWFLMRAEEMIFIQAEGLAMSNKAAEGKAVLENFVKTHRNPDYTIRATTAEQVRDEIWFQRRIELWGEGFSFYDVMRLKKPIIRVVNGVTSFPVAFRFNIEPTNPILLWLVPKDEIEANKGISEEDNNPKVDPPKPI